MWRSWAERVVWFACLPFPLVRLVCCWVWLSLPLPPRTPRSVLFGWFDWLGSLALKSPGSAQARHLSSPLLHELPSSHWWPVAGSPRGPTSSSFCLWAAGFFSPFLRAFFLLLVPGCISHRPHSGFWWLAARRSREQKKQLHHLGPFPRESDDTASALPPLLLPLLGSFALFPVESTKNRSSGSPPRGQMPAAPARGR